MKKTTAIILFAILISSMAISQVSTSTKEGGLDVGVCAIDSPEDTYCGFSALTPKVWIKNYDDVIVTAVVVMYRIDYFPPVTKDAKVNIAPGDSALVEFDPINLNSGTHAIQFVSSYPNGGDDPVSSNNSLGHNFEFSNGQQYIIELMTDSYAYETSWVLKNSLDQIIASNGTLANNSFYETTVCLTPDCYTFYIYDDFGDGICAGYGDGYYSIIEGTTVIDTDCAYGTNTSFEFCVNIPEGPPAANFSHSTVNDCSGEVQFFDNSLCSPDATSWLWSFGDGSTSTEQNPTHVYNINGMYDISLEITNANGTSSLSITNFIEISRTPPPFIADQFFCQDAASIIINAPDDIDELQWYIDPYDEEPISISDSYTIPSPSLDTIIYYQLNAFATIDNVGLVDNTGPGGFFGFSIDRAIYFDAISDIIIKSATVFANGAGNRTITLKNSFGTTIDSRVINIPDGESIIVLDFEVLQGDNYAIHVNTANNLAYTGDYDATNIGYPFTIANTISITGNNYGDNFWYFFYNIEVQKGFQDYCSSSIEPLNISMSNPEVFIGNDTVICDGSSITLSSDTEFSEYLWSNESTENELIVNEEMLYSLTVTNEHSCTASAEISIELADEILFTSDFTNASSEDTEDAWIEITTTQGTEPLTIAWSNGSTDFTLTDLTHGTYYFTITDNFACSITDSIVIDFEQSSVSKNSFNNIDIFPNPFTDIINISIEDNISATISIYNIHGQVVDCRNTDKAYISIDLSFLSNGVYFIEIISESQIIKSKLVKE